MSAFFTLPGFVAFLVLMVGLYGTYRLFRSMRAHDRRQVPVSVSPDVAQKHLALIYLIRGGEALILVPILLVVLLIFFGFFLSIFHNVFQGTVGHGTLFSVVMLICLCFVTAFVMVKLPNRILKSRHEFFLNILVVNTTNISTFSFFFAALAAHDFYRLMPPVASPATSYMANRDFLWVIVFFLIWTYLKTLLGRLLEVSPSRPSQDPPDDRHIPEFPQKSPLLPL